MNIFNNVLKSSTLSKLVHRNTVITAIRNRNSIARTPLQVLTDDGADFYESSGLQRKLVDKNEVHQDDSLVRTAKNKKQNRSNSSSDETEPRKKANHVNSRKGQFRKLLKQNATQEPATMEFVKTIMSINARNGKVETPIILLEGAKLIGDALNAGVKLKTVYFADKKNLRSFENINQLKDGGVEFKHVPRKEIELFSHVVTSPGVLAVFEKPNLAQLFKNSAYSKDEIPKIPVTLIADNIRDPGNMGTLIRSAAAAGIEKMICTAGCVDIWEPKVIRAGAGSHFRVDLTHSKTWEELEEIIRQDEDLLKNVFFAEALLSGYKKKSADNDKTIVESEACKKTNYYEAGFGSCKKIALIVGNESQGLTHQARRVIRCLDATQLWIPLSGGVDSLNSSIAASLILYEIRRQTSNTIAESNSQ